MVKVSLYICTSEDGFIADKSGGVGWLPPMGPEGQSNYENYFATVDVVIMGSRSYEKVTSFGMDWPYAGKPSYVFTKRDLTSDREDIIITSEDPQSFVERIKTNTDPPVGKIWLMGGSELIKSFVQDKLIDEIILFTIPKSLGEGIPLGINLDEDFTKINEDLVGNLQMREFVKKTE
jgi:dihydrofolate reductase